MRFAILSFFITLIPYLAERLRIPFFGIKIMYYLPLHPHGRSAGIGTFVDLLHKIAHLISGLHSVLALPYSGLYFVFEKGDAEEIRPDMDSSDLLSPQHVLGVRGDVN
jgi:hypothetical protein